MTDKKRLDLEVIEAYRQQARSRRLSSTLASPTGEKASREVFSRGEVQLDLVSTKQTVEGVVQSKDGKVTVTMKGAKPIPKREVTQFFGHSSVSIPEFRSAKESILGSARSEHRNTSLAKKPR
jgi:hypothetical protein